MLAIELLCCKTERLRDLAGGGCWPRVKPAS